jgi:hypothetical protein
VIVAIPSKDRAGKVRSQRVIPSALVFVPSGEERAYEQGGAQHLVTVPPSVRGVTATRNFILDYAKDIGETDVVMIDDDVKAQGWVELGRHSLWHVRLPERQWLAEWARLFALSAELGSRIWGVATQSASRSVYPWKPFLERSYVTASCMGIRAETGIRFDESFPVKEDYELCLRCMKEDGRVLAARHVYWENAHWADNGGCSGYRTQAMEKDVTERLIAMYPGMIRRVTRGGSGYSIELGFAND